MGKLKSKTMTFLNKAESKSLKDEFDFWTPSDLAATAVMIWPQLSKKSLITNVTPVTDGAAKGAILVDYTQKSGKPKNVEIVQELNIKEFQQKLMYHFS